jgi:poly-beta-hydroxyalkanoate depolymerase
MSDDKERATAISRFYESYKAARDIIRAETGLKRLDAIFRSVTKAKYSSALID